MFRRMVNIGVLSPEAKAKLKEDEKELDEGWDNLAMYSTCKDAIDDLSRIYVCFCRGRIWRKYQFIDHRPNHRSNNR